MKKKLKLIFVSLFISANLLAQHPFSEEVINDLLPYTKGIVKQQTIFDNPFNLKYSTQSEIACKQISQKIVSILSAWQGLQPPKGFEANFTTFIAATSDNEDENAKNPAVKMTTSIELKFAPYVFQSDRGKFADYEFALGMSIFINNLSGYIVGSPIVKNIYLCPQKAGDFYGEPIYLVGGGHEITIISKPGTQLFIPVSQEEYLKVLIEEEKKKSPEKFNKKEKEKEAEASYNELLKVDRAAAEQFKKEMVEDLRLMEISSSKMDIVSMLEKELQTMSESERKRQAYYSQSALEDYNKVSGLCPLSALSQGDPLIKFNPNLTGTFSANDIKTIVLSWPGLRATGEDKNILYQYTDKDLEYEPHRWNVLGLYRQADIWKKIIGLTK